MAGRSAWIPEPCCAALVHIAEADGAFARVREDGPTAGLWTLGTRPRCVSSKPWRAVRLLRAVQSAACSVASDCRSSQKHRSALIGKTPRRACGRVLGDVEFGVKRPVIRVIRGMAGRVVKGGRKQRWVRALRSSSRWEGPYGCAMRGLVSIVAAGARCDWGNLEAVLG